MAWNSNIPETCRLPEGCEKALRSGAAMVALAEPRTSLYIMAGILSSHDLDAMSVVLAPTRTVPYIMTRTQTRSTSTTHSRQWISLHHLGGTQAALRQFRNRERSRFFMQ